MAKAESYGKRTKLHATELLDVGDTITDSVTVHLRVGGVEAWLKCEATTTVNKDESAQDASDRVLDFAELEIARQADALELG